MADGDPVTLSIYNGPTASASDDTLYMSHDVGAPSTEASGIYAFTNLNAASPTRTLAWADPDNNTTSARGSIVTDVLGNVIYFENSNEQVVLVSPPSGPNSYKYRALDSLKLTASGTVRPLLTLSEARADSGGTRKPHLQGDTVRVVGIVNSVNIQTTNFGYFMQDDNAGIEIFKAGLSGAPTLAPGYRVMVTGKIDFFSGTTEITPAAYSDISIIDTGNVVKTIPLTIGQYKANAESYESRRIQLAVVQPLNFTSANWPAAGIAANLNVWDGKDTLILRIDSDTEIDGSPFPTFPVKLTGVASQFANNAAADTGYQITPMFNSDFVPINTPPFNNFSLLTPANNSTVVLNDTAQVVSFSWRRAVDFNKTDTALVYQWLPVGFSAIGTGNGGKDSSLARTGKQMLTYLGSKDTVVLKWTVATKDPTNPVVYCKDTSSVKVIRGTITGVQETQGIPTVFALEQNYPNPFNPSTIVRFALPQQAFVTLKVYDILGREVATLVNEERSAGFFDVTWNGTNGYGVKVASGVYFYRVEAKPVAGGSTFISLKKMMLLK
jgi:hypothetical protein